MDVQRGVDVVLIVDDVPVAGQLKASLNRNMTEIEITNQIKADWQDSIGGIKSWNVGCSGAYIIGTNSFNLLEEAFMTNKKINVKIKLGENNYEGKGLITNFPLNATYNSQFKYTINILGCGALIKK